MVNDLEGSNTAKDQSVQLEACSKVGGSRGESGMYRCLDYPNMLDV